MGIWYMYNICVWDKNGIRCSLLFIKICICTNGIIYIFHVYVHNILYKYVKCVHYRTHLYIYVIFIHNIYVTNMPEICNLHYKHTFVTYVVLISNRFNIRSVHTVYVNTIYLIYGNYNTCAVHTVCVNTIYFIYGNFIHICVWDLPVIKLYTWK